MSKEDKLAIAIIFFSLVLGGAYYFTKIQNYEDFKIKKISDETVYDYKVDINLAEQEEFENLPGIGTATAKKIIEARQLERFATVGELRRVSGIGKKKLAAIEKYLYVSAAPLSD